jgi:hypothetical protein
MPCLSCAFSLFSLFSFLFSSGYTLFLESFMSPEQPQVTVAALEFEPHADGFLGSPFWNSILHRKANDTESKWQHSRLFFMIDVIFGALAMLWLRWYLHKRVKEKTRL